MKIASTFLFAFSLLTAPLVADEIEPTISPEDSLSHFRVREGYEVQLVAAEPLIFDPVAIDWGPDGRLWVVEMNDYPLGMDNKGEPGGHVKFLEDTNGDGRYDKSTVFAEKLPFPNGVMAWRDGVLITAAPDILFARDTNGDGHADEIEKLYTGTPEVNTQLRINGMRWGYDNWVYLANGFRNSATVRSAKTGDSIEIRGRDLRIDPDRGRIEFVAGPTQYGRDRDDWGNWFGVTNYHPLWHYVIEPRYLERNGTASVDKPYQMLFTAPEAMRVYPAKPPEKRYHSFSDANHFASAGGSTIYRDDLLFDDSAIHAFTCEPVHNLVHHAELHEDGVTFTATRAAEEATSEILASDDRWCRPVLARTGPDGALWVVDIYRYVIEHPEYLTDVGRQELEPLYRAGSEQGRIYRVVKKGTPLRPVPTTADASVEQLLELLSHPNGIVRDLAHKELIWRNATSTIEPLRQMTKTGAPKTKLHALGLLHGLGGLQSDDVVRALKDENPYVRRLGLQLWEMLPDRDTLFPAIRALTKDPSAKVRFQLACALGESHSEDVAPALLDLYAQDGGGTFPSAAIISSVNAQNVVSLLKLAQSDPAQYQSLIAPLCLLAFELENAHAVQLAVGALSGDWPGLDAVWRWSTLSKLMTWLNARQRTIATEPLLNDQQRSALQHTRLEAVATTSNTKADPDLRIVAIQLLGKEPSTRQNDMTAFETLLSAQESVRVQQAAIQALAALGDAAGADMVLKNWSALSPALRAAAMQTLITRSAWQAKVIEALDQGKISPQDLDARQRQTLIRQVPAELKERAERVLKESSNLRRADVVQAYLPAIDIPGNIDQGRKIFAAKCSSCHRLENVGTEVGADLRLLSDRSRRSLLTAILDPSFGVDPRFRLYVASTLDGRVLNGLLYSETDESVVLLDAQAQKHTLLRSELEEFRGTPTSLMPDGLEKEMTVEQMSNLLAYLEAVLGPTN